MIIGIPRALLYYWYGGVWEDFWHAAGAETLVSPPTDQMILTAGTEVALDELCLPVKIFLGHLRYLNSRVDYVMLPHLIKVEADAYICPKFMGLPDLARQTVPDIGSKLISVTVGQKSADFRTGLFHAAQELGLKVPKDFLPPKGRYIPDNPGQALVQSYEKWSVPKSGLTVGLLGHPYCLYDPELNLNLLDFLSNQGLRFITPELMPASYLDVGAGKLNKSLFWTIGRTQFDALEWMLNDPVMKIDGFIHLASFACGPEAVVGDLLERRIKAARKPLLKLNFEEQSGEAGMITRLEAFLDLIHYQRRAC